jgi:hypothetical protein
MQPKAPIVALPLAPCVRQRMLAAGFTFVQDIQTMPAHELAAGEDLHVGTQVVNWSSALSAGRALGSVPFTGDLRSSSYGMPWRLHDCHDKATLYQPIIMLSITRS